MWSLDFSGWYSWPSAYSGLTHRSSEQHLQSFLFNKRVYAFPTEGVFLLQARDKLKDVVDMIDLVFGRAAQQLAR